MSLRKLTEKSIASIAPPTATDDPQAYYWDTDVKGFGVVVGRTGTRTFVVRGRAAGERVKAKIGIEGRAEGRDDGQVWTVKLARQRAKELLGEMAAGVNPNAEHKPSRGGPTLRAVLEFHVERMRRGENRRGKVCSERSITTLEGDIKRHFGAYLERPIVELDADAIENVLRKIERETVRTSGSNPANPPGRALANRLLVNIGTIWRSYHKRHGLPVANPTERLTVGALKPRDTRIADDGFVAWHAKVLAMKNPVRRDLQVAGLFSGLRTESLRTLRWEDVDFDDELIQIERAKGDRPFTIPLTATLREILERRQRDNAIEFKPLGGDHGNVFPSITRDQPFRVIPVAEVKERELDADGDRVTALPGIHASRRTYNSVAIEIACPQEIREALLNHAGRGVNVKSYGRPQRWDHLAEWAAKIESALWERLKPGKPAKRRKLRAV